MNRSARFFSSLAICFNASLLGTRPSPAFRTSAVAVSQYPTLISRGMHLGGGHSSSRATWASVTWAAARVGEAASSSSSQVAARTASPGRNSTLRSDIIDVSIREQAESMTNGDESIDSS